MSHATDDVAAFYDDKGALQAVVRKSSVDGISRESLLGTSNRCVVHMSGIALRLVDVGIETASKQIFGEFEGK